VGATVRALPLLPEACGLNELERQSRVADWRRLGADAQVSSRLQGTSLEVTFRNHSEVATELHRLIAAERNCCSFLDWSLTSAPDTLTLTVSSRAERPDPDVERLAQLFGAR
jgi:hypothetical protein